jgi:NADH-quinone oxidoreductase subunit L
LLIGFWFKDSEKAAAGMKAFIANRIGDAALLLGGFLLFLQFNTLEFSEILSKIPEGTEIGLGVLTVSCLLLFVGATGKSAQIPLYVWLPDAMAGPTPVSALIHAATIFAFYAKDLIRSTEVRASEIRNVFVGTWIHI